MSMQRESIIEALVLKCVDRIISYRSPVWIHSLLENGFVGFANMRDDELRHACIKYGLRYEEYFCESLHEEFDSHPDSDNDESEEMEIRSFLPVARDSEGPECV